MPFCCSNNSFFALMLARDKADTLGSFWLTGFITSFESTVISN
jgi:hypothetical protein